MRCYICNPVTPIQRRTRVRSTHVVSNAFCRSTKATNVRADLRDDKTSRSVLTSTSCLADVELGRDEWSNAETDQMLEEFEAARRKRHRAIVGGETGVSTFEYGHNNAPFPQSGNHTPGQLQVEEIEHGALPPRERD